MSQSQLGNVYWLMWVNVQYAYPPWESARELSAFVREKNERKGEKGKEGR